MQFSDGFSLSLKLTLTFHISVFQGVAFKRDIVLTIKLSVGCRRLLNIIIEPHGRGVPEVILNGRSPRPGLPE